MALRVLFVILVYFFLEIQVQALLPPKLTVNPPVITGSDSVTLNCQTPSSVSVTQCSFYSVSGGNMRKYSCLKTLTATELLLMTSQSSPAEVKVKCFYSVQFGELNLPSPHSDTTTIVINTLLPPKLTVNPSVITDSDSVTLNCQTPSSVSVTQCSFQPLRGGNVRKYSCLKKLTATELLLMTSQSSPAEVEVKCFYTVQHGELNLPSPHSDMSMIVINSQKPQMSVQHFPGDHVVFTCSLPGSTNPDSKCNLYFGETGRPVQTKNIRGKTTKDQWFCQFFVPVDELLRRLRSVKQSDATCDYTLGSDLNSLSPHSDGYSLTNIMENESNRTPTFRVTTGLPFSSSSTSPSTEGNRNSMSPGWTVSRSSKTGGSTSASITPETSASEMWIWMIVAVVAGCGVTVGIISAVCYNHRKAGGSKQGSKQVKRQKSQHGNNDTYHMYDTIVDEPVPPPLYCTVQAH